MALLKALCWALIFMIRIRFPPGTSLATVLNNRHKDKVLTDVKHICGFKLQVCPSLPFRRCFPNEILNLDDGS